MSKAASHAYISFLKGTTYVRAGPPPPGALAGESPPAQTSFQFERLGFYVVDQDSEKGSLVFNRTVEKDKTRVANSRISLFVFPSPAKRPRFQKREMGPISKRDHARRKSAASGRARGQSRVTERARTLAQGRAGSAARQEERRQVGRPDDHVQNRRARRPLLAVRRRGAPDARRERRARLQIRLQKVQKGPAQAEKTLHSKLKAYHRNPSESKYHTRYTDEAKHTLTLKVRNPQSAQANLKHK